MHKDISATIIFLKTNVDNSYYTNFTIYGSNKLISKLANFSFTAFNSIAKWKKTYQGTPFTGHSYFSRCFSLMQGPASIAGEIFHGNTVALILQKICLFYFCTKFKRFFSSLSCTWHQTTNPPIYENFRRNNYLFSAKFLCWNQPTFFKYWRCLKMHLTASIKKIIIQNFVKNYLWFWWK